MSNNQNFFPMSAKRDAYGNLQGVATPAYNQVGADDSLAVQQAKQQAQNRAWQQNGMMNPASWAEFAQAQPGRAAAAASGQEYNFGNAIADVLGAYWNKQAQQAQDAAPNAGINHDLANRTLQSVMTPASLGGATPAPTGSGSVLSVLDGLRNFF